MDMLNTNTRFSQAPQANIPRSTFGRPSDLKTTHSFGKLIPLDWDEVLPAQTKNRKLGSLIRMSTPLYPVMDNAIYDVYSFFVPLRLCWNHAKEFFGENKDSAWVSDQEYIKPALDCVGKQFAEDSIFDYMGLPTKVTVPAGEFIDALLSAPTVSFGMNGSVMRTCKYRSILTSVTMIPQTMIFTSS